MFVGAGGAVSEGLAADVRGWRGGHRPPVLGAIADRRLVLATGAAIGGLAGDGWGSALFGAVVAAPIAAFGFMLPNVLLGILVVLEVFSCAS